MTVLELKRSFNFAYQKDPNVIYFVPGRVNLIGEHTDYNDVGKPSILSFGIYLLLCKNEEKCIKLWSLNEPDVIRLDINQLSTMSDKTWIQYPVSVFAEYIKLGVEITDGYNILIWGNIPKNATISSTDALKVITSYALDDQFGTNFICTILDGVRSQDEYKFTFLNYDILKHLVTTSCIKDEILKFVFRFIEQNFLPIKMDGIKIIISNTHTPHKLDSAPYKQRMTECKMAVEQLYSYQSLKPLVELTAYEIDSTELISDEPSGLKRARHVVSELQRVSDATKALKEGNLILFCQLMNDSHISLRDNYELVTPELDSMVTEVWKFDGVIGSRMTGGGFGGCTVSLVKDEAIETFIERAGSIYETATGIKPQFYIAEIGDVACKLCYND